MNPMDLIKNLKDVQSRMSEMQEKMKEIKVTGTAGGDMVSVDMDGQMSVQKVTISPEAVDPEDIEMLEDLVLAAFTDASAKIREKLQDEMKSVTGGLDLPPGFPGM
ncbi:MAG: YbaB/EbfC family nucleoid-associated protein [Spirochaetales bacterium]|nr:YbaB/EbfC family nucleoid-associated protein [Spirochaetales bacterium]